METRSQMMDIRHKTIVHALIHNANVKPDALAFNFLDKNSNVIESQTYSNLLSEALGWASLISRLTRADDRVILSFLPGKDFGSAFLGTIIAGRVAVPTTPPKKRGRVAFTRIVENSAPSLILCSLKIEMTLNDIYEGNVPIHSAYNPLDTFEISTLPDQNKLAFIQYTSGSTSSPKGVMVSHNNIATNQAYIEHCFGHDDSSRILGWLPVYHDMGLIGTFMQPLWLGTTGYLMSPQDFATEPLSWLILQLHLSICHPGQSHSTVQSQ